MLELITFFLSTDSDILNYCPGTVWKWRWKPLINCAVYSWSSIEGFGFYRFPFFGETACEGWRF